jgi:hypothetical protein
MKFAELVNLLLFILSSTLYGLKQRFPTRVSQNSLRCSTRNREKETKIFETSWKIQNSFEILREMFLAFDSNFLWPVKVFICKFPSGNEKLFHVFPIEKRLENTGLDNSNVAK